MIFAGGMALGSALWGIAAEHISTTGALLVAAGGILLTVPLVKPLPLLRGTPPDLSPFMLDRPAPQVVIEPDLEEGPVLITIEYLVTPENYDEFVREIHHLRTVRMRDGAVRWGVYQDTANPKRLVETFVTASWLDFLRERERMTAADREIRDRVRQLHEGPNGPAVSRMIYARERSGD
jgi:quinol monooxygenase YgiN